MQGGSPLHAGDVSVSYGDHFLRVIKSDASNEIIDSVGSLKVLIYNMIAGFEYIKGF